MSRRSALKIGALAGSIPVAAILGGASVAAFLGSREQETVPGDDTQTSTRFPSYQPVPETARGPVIPESGYLAEQIRDGVYWLTDGSYQMMFVVTDAGVVVVDAPPTLGNNILRAIAEVTDQRVTHMVYSHADADHVGAASLMPAGTVYVGHRQTQAILQRNNDPNRPVPTVVFDTEYELAVGGKSLSLAYRGPNHSPDNIFIWSESSRVLMVTDIVFPGWVPFKNLAVSRDIQGWVEAHDIILEYPFENLIGGHLNRLGTRENVLVQKEYVQDLFDFGTSALDEVPVQDIFAEYGPTGNSWAIFKSYLDEASQITTDRMLEKWGNRLGGADVFTFDNAFAMIEALRLEYGRLGPFGVRP